MAGKRLSVSVCQGERTRLNKNAARVKPWSRRPPAMALRGRPPRSEQTAPCVELAAGALDVGLCRRLLLGQTQNYVFTDFEDASKRTTWVPAIHAHIGAARILLLIPEEGVHSDCAHPFIDPSRRDAWLLFASPPPRGPAQQRPLTRRLVRATESSHSRLSPDGPLTL